MANGYIGDNRIRPLEKAMRTMCQRKGYDLDMVFKGFLDYLLWMFDPDGNKPDGWRYDSEDAKTFFDMAHTYFTLMAEVLQKVEWYDAFGDLFMALHPNGGGRGQFFTPQDVCNMVASVCMGDKPIDEINGRQTPFGKRVCIDDCAAGSSRLLLAGASAFRKLQKDKLGYDEVKCATYRPYLVAEDLDYNCVKMSAINMMMHGCFGEAVCHDSLCEPDQVRLGYIVNETQWPFHTPIPSIRRYSDPRRFVCTSFWMARKEANVKEDDSKKEAQEVTEAPKEIAEEKKTDKQPLQLTLF